MVITRTSTVDKVLDNSRVGHRERSKDESPEDSSDGLTLDTNLSQSGVYNSLHDRDEDHNGNGINVLHDIVGESMKFHLISLGNKVVDHLSIYNPVNGVEKEDLTGID
ncbi:hypothetical protein AWJ20_2920 [Sugiyamaella lignohabitans]|uniref:Uncharacterized protein n=1 Tax=Sugiyamaella lignohabitans TaxID=796027 RepID=A0A167FH78_9ASCO|nr:uncharacterized protein AWJ20_2920 [Sugiyamaella lignohabitans]ANB15293.1 hypothetical protein AWJ20_2920 [Sugiyamaella lignohabitans]